MKVRRRNVVIMWIASFFIAGSMTMVLPFLSLLIESYGGYTDEQVQLWAGLTFGISFIVAFLFSPIWGRFGDQRGRKTVLIILAFGVSVSVFLMGFVTSAVALFVLRMFMGLFAGFISMAQALIAAQTPRHIAGKVLGTLQTGAVSGTLCGPLIGGVLADTFGYQYTFLLTALLTSIAATFVIFGVKELRIRKHKKGERTYTRREVLQYIFRSPILITIMLMATLFQMSNLSVQPILALFVGQLSTAENIALLSGIAFSVTGLGNLAVARRWGIIGDKIGHEKVLIFLAFICALLFIPQAFVTEVWQLIVLRFLFGLGLGGLIPCQVAFVRQVTPLSIQGEVLGYNTSFRFLGNFSGPILGGMLASLYGLQSVFWGASIVFMISGALLWIIVKRSGATYYSEL